MNGSIFRKQTIPHLTMIPILSKYTRETIVGTNYFIPRDHQNIPMIKYLIIKKHLGGGGQS